MYQVFLRFYEELNDFLPQKRRKVEFSHSISDKISVKNVIESLGIPHTEVDLILVNHTSVDFSYIVRPNDRISVYPMFESFDITPVTRLRSKPLRGNRFVLDVHLGKLAVYLRFAGFDTLYRNDYRDEELAFLSAKEHRILLSRDRELLKRHIITHGYYVRETHPKRQLAEVFKRFQLSVTFPLQQRCTQCNAIIQPIDKASISHRLLPNTNRHFDEFCYCRNCDKIYWKGSHYQSMMKYLQEMRN